MKKIVKLEGSYDVPQLKQKLNEIIDYLNSQDQEEENTVCEGCGKTITSRFMQSYTKGDGMHSYCLSCDPEKQDTPEQKEELVEIKKKLNGISVEYNIIDRIDVIWEEIENLLSEREKEAYFKGKEYQAKLDRECYGMSFEKLDKLNK